MQAASLISDPLEGTAPSDAHIRACVLVVACRLSNLFFSTFSFQKTYYLTPCFPSCKPLAIAVFTTAVSSSLIRTSHVLRSSYSPMCFSHFLYMCTTNLLSHSLHACTILLLSMGWLFSHYIPKFQSPDHIDIVTHRRNSADNEKACTCD